MESYMYPVKEG